MIEVKMTFNSIEHMLSELAGSKYIPAPEPVVVDIPVPPVTVEPVVVDIPVPPVTVEPVVVDIPAPPPVNTEPTPEPVNTEELDSAGHQWDARIHTIKRTKKANGEWKLMRGVDKDLVEQIINEESLQDMGAAVGNTTAADIAPSDVQAKLVSMMTTGVIDANTMTNILANHDIPNMMALSLHPEKMSAIMQELEAI